MKDHNTLELTGTGEIAVNPEYPQLVGKVFRLNTHPGISATRRLQIVPVSLTRKAGEPTSEGGGAPQE